MRSSVSSVKNITRLAVIVIGFIGMFLITDPTQALAQSKDLSGMQQNIATQIVSIPKLIATLAYVIAVFFAATGLLKLKDWINEPEKNPLNQALFRIVVASLLIVFPHVLIIINTSLFGAGSNGSTQSVNISVPMHRLNAFEK